MRLRETEIWKYALREPRMILLFLELLDRAVWEKSGRVFCKRGMPRAIRMKYGEVFVSTLEMSGLCGASRKKTRSMLNFIRKINFAAIQKGYNTAKQGKVYLIVKYGDYQNPLRLKGQSESSDKGQSRGHTGAIQGPYTDCETAKNVASQPPHKITILQEEKKSYSSLTSEPSDQSPPPPSPAPKEKSQTFSLPSPEEGNPMQIPERKLNPGEILIQLWESLFLARTGRTYRKTCYDYTAAMDLAGNGNGDLHHAQELAEFLFSSQDPRMKYHQAPNRLSLRALLQHRDEIARKRKDIAAELIAEKIVAGNIARPDLPAAFPHDSDEILALAWELAANPKHG